jgi:hypothetical protein
VNADWVTRRTFLAAAGAAGAALLAADPALVQAALNHARATAELPLPARFESLTPTEAAGLNAITMRIFPSDGTPGAKEAGVIHFIDKSLATWASGMKQQLVDGLIDLDRRAGGSFATLSSARQDELLKAVEQTPFFGTMRFATVVGMFANSSWGGNAGDVGWKLLGFQNHGVFQPPFGYYDAQVAQGG